MSSNGGPRLRFGQIELDLSEEKLLKKGVPLRLGNQPLQLLAVLLENPGEIVSREELFVRLWPEGTYVDFDEGLNTAIKKLRYALGDSAENPIFIETVPRRGYRFIAPVQGFTPQAEPSESEEPNLLTVPARNPSESRVVTPAISLLSWSTIWRIGLVCLVVAAAWFLYGTTFPPALHVTKISRLTSSGSLEWWGGLASDGSRLFYLERDGDHWNDRQISLGGGESAPFGSPSRNTKIFAVSPNQAEVLFAPFTSRDSNLQLWSMPLVGGAPRRVGNLVATAGTYSPDGTRIAVANTSGVFVANRDGSDLRQLAALPSWAVAWSPNGKILRFTTNSNRLWQVTSTGRDLHAFLPSWAAWGGQWTSDGSYYVFHSPKEGRSSLWAVRDSPFFSWLQPAPAQLTSTPLSLDSPLPSHDGSSIYAIGGEQTINVFRYDPASRQSRPVLAGVNVAEASFSPDHQWMLYSRGNQLWRSHPDGSERLQIVEGPLIPDVHAARWSPDSKRILFEDTEGGLTGKIYLVSGNGGPAQQPLPFPQDQYNFWPDWSPDGKAMVFSRAGEGVDPSVQGLYLFDFEKHNFTKIPDSAGVDLGRWSPDGRFLAGVSHDTSVMKILDLKTHHWSEVARGTLLTWPVWSADSVLYFQDILAPGEPVYRFRPGSSAPQRAYSFEDILESNGIRCGFLGFGPDGSLLVQVNRGGGDVYALTVSHP